MFQPPPIQSPVPSCTLTPVSESFSLAKTLTGCPFLDFYKFAELLSRIKPQEIQGKESLVQRIKFEMTQGSSNERSSQIAQSIDHAIFNQAIDPITGAARELVSNAIDAHTRSGRCSSPIYIYVRDHRLEIQDSGDGFDWESVFHYCVLGRSKSRGLSSQERYKNISGTFGQGGYTPFYYLLFDRNGALPCFKMNTNGLCELDIPYQFLQKNGVYRFTFLASTQLPQTHTVSIQDIPQLPKKFIIHTKREESIQMIFSQQQQHLIFDIKDSSKSTVGSHFYLQSPLIEEEKERIINYLKVAFAYIEGPPIFLNNEQINAPTSSQSLVLEEGTLYFNPQLSLHGRLLIYEKGRLIPFAKNKFIN